MFQCSFYFLVVEFSISYVPICGAARLQGSKGKGISLTFLVYLPAEPITYVILHVTDKKQWPTSFALLVNCGTYDGTGDFSRTIWKHVEKPAVGKGYWQRVKSLLNLISLQMKRNKIKKARGKSLSKGISGGQFTIRRVFRQFVSYALTIAETFVLL